MNNSNSFEAGPLDKRQLKNPSKVHLLHRPIGYLVRGPTGIIQFRQTQYNQCALPVYYNVSSLKYIKTQHSAL